jgi:hypothetical protein
VVINTAFGLSYAVWLLIGYYQAIPAEVEEAAMVDGASRLRAVLAVTMPLSWPGIVAAAIFTFMSAWNDFLFALTFISHEDKTPITVGLIHFIGHFQVEWNYLMAASLITTAIVLALFMTVQQHLTRGLLAGGVKEPCVHRYLPEPAAAALGTRCCAYDRASSSQSAPDAAEGRTLREAAAGLTVVLRSPEFRCPFVVGVSLGGAIAQVALTTEVIAAVRDPSLWATAVASPTARCVGSENHWIRSYHRRAVPLPVRRAALDVADEDGDRAAEHRQPFK